MDPQTLTTDTLLAELVSSGDLTADDVEQLLGRDRHGLQLPKLEKLLLDRNVLSENRLLRIKGAITGRPLLTDPDLEPTPQLPEKVAMAVGAVTLNRTPLTVAMVEDDATNIAAVTEHLGQKPEIWLCSIHQFQTLFLDTYRPADSAGNRRRRNPAAKDLYELLDIVLDRGGSDLHLQVGLPPHIRVAGSIRTLPRHPIDAEWMRTEVNRLLDDYGHSQIQEFGSLDHGFAFGDVRFRANIAQDINGYTLSARVLPPVVPSMEELGLPPAVQQLADRDRGLVVVTGPTGAGKTTTLAAIQQHILNTYSRRIITLEDPVEYHLTPRIGTVSQRELGRSVPSFPRGLKDALRQDPDVILVGELRDLETLRTALSAAEAGLLVFTTMHASNAETTLSRMLSMFPAGEQEHVRHQLAYLLQGIVSQVLLARNDQAGRVAAFEVLIGVPNVRNTLRAPMGLTQVRQLLTSGASDGMQTLEQSLAQLARDGIVSPEEAQFRAPNQEEYQKRRNS